MEAVADILRVIRLDSAIGARTALPGVLARGLEMLHIGGGGASSRFICGFLACDPELSQPPIAYLTRWRLQLAARALTSTSHSVAQIAADVGYESEAAFNRAFKRQFDLPPARYRRERAAEGRSGAAPAGADA
jgi:Helix-turn-helix domain